MIYELVKAARSVRRFDNSKKISPELLERLVDSARLAPNGGNRQRIRYATVTSQRASDEMRAALSFAAYLKDWGGPIREEDPTAYIVLLAEEEDTTLFIDAGIAAEVIQLAAREEGLGACMFRSFKPAAVKAALECDSLIPLLVIALGVPSETVYTEDIKDGDYKYYRNEKDEHVVPKRTLGEVLVIKK